MSSDADKAWDRAIGKLRKKKGYSPLTPEEAKAAYESAPAVPLSAARISEIVKFATGGSPEMVKPLTLVEWSRRFPLKMMRQFQFSLAEDVSDAEALLDYFGVRSPETWRLKWDAQPVAFRQTQVFDAQKEAVSAWVREAEIEAAKLKLADFDADRLRSSLGRLRSLTRKKVGDALEEAIAICAQFGVALVLVPGLPGTRISGCARWLNDKHALIGLTIRYKTDDQLWFTFFHEVAHILLHRGLQTFVIDNAVKEMGDEVVDVNMARYEEEADRFSADTLIPPDLLAAFLRIHGETLGNKEIYDFSETIGIGPGILVGRLQRDKVLEHWQGNEFKQKLEWGFTPEE
ncbi:ImmA/IrrE family metallo-endopeptidase [Zavarzinella formosa]|uniref:ImmA/IrrE family metallo-endopeptidase n=1 Tax=Zavarzinella formosa TaxID=360055 RepID=UPI0002FEA7B5|nr:ImmA/IrrE family metallo-endopeptidase [Zavarzinella formosa]